jgi:hypothetical protein
MIEVLTSTNDDGNFIVGAYYAMTLNIVTKENAHGEHIPITVKCLPTREKLNGETCQHFQRVKVSDPTFKGHIFSLTKAKACSMLPETLPELAEGEEF